MHSIFGLQEIKKEEKADYSICEFILDQESIGGEAFDFAIKLIINHKNYLKIKSNPSIYVLLGHVLNHIT